MKKRALIAAAIAVAAVVVAAVAGPLLIPTSIYSRWLESKIAQPRNLRISVEKVGVQFLPYPGYTIRGFNLVSTDAPFQGLSIISAKKIRGSLSLLGLVRGKAIVSIRATDATVDIRTADGRSNLDALTSKAPSDDGLEVRAIELSKARVNFWESGVGTFSIGSIRLSAGNISQSGGFGADIRMAGRLYDTASAATGGKPQQADITISGRVTQDSRRREIAARALRFSLAGTQMTTDFSINYGISPASFDIHIASPDLSSASLLPFAGQSSGALLPGVEWQGSVAADLSLKGTRDACEIIAQMDATTAMLAVGGFFKKGAGLPLKVSLSLLASPTELAVREGNLSLGQQNFGIKGNIMRNEVLTAHLAVSASGLADTSLKFFFPRLALVESFEGLDLSADISGPLVSAIPMSASGSFKAGKAKMLGIELSDATGSFERSAAQGSISFPVLKASLYGGSISGNGSVLAGEMPEISFDGVAEHIDAAALPPIKGLIAGEASFVVHAASRGADAAFLVENLKLSGSLVIPKGTWSGAKQPAQVFSADTWKSLEESTATALTTAAEEKLAASAGTIESFNAAFESAEGILKATSVSWSHDNYEAKTEATVDRALAVKGEGEISIAKAMAFQLVPPAAQRLLLNDSGKLVIPVTLGGKLPEIEMRADREKLAARIKEKATGIPAGKQAIQQAKPEEPAKPEAASLAPQAPAKQKKPKAPAAPQEKKSGKPVLTPKQSDEDVLKVIIGR
ncbi:MAG: AsmA family protein [Pseudomonadota bacterium]